MSVSVFIDGAAGTTGLEIRERLAGRSDIDLLTLADSDRKDAGKRSEALRSADFVVLCLPDDAARESVALIGDAPTRVVDASTAHRVAPDWVYGMAELEPGQQDRIAAARYVANPGCYPTGFLALVRPLVRAGLIPADLPIATNATSGYSGGGKAMIAEFETASPAPKFRPYGITLAHKHVPEMQGRAGLSQPPIFLPAVVDTYRGMVVEVPLFLSMLNGRPTLAAIEDVLREAYAGSPVIDVAASNPDAIRIEENAGTDRLTLRVCGNEATGQARLVATLDNLGKGAAGAAVQNLNIMAGLDPVAGLILQKEA